MPPYADDIYSADDSDDESNVNEADLSPTDGYFNRRESSNFMVPDPSLGSNSTAESKAREAREEAEALERTIGSHQAPQTPLSHISPLQTALSNFGAGTTLYTRTSPSTTQSSSPQRRQPDIYSEASPLLYSSAPPAYSPSPSSSSSQREQRNYSTVSNPTSENRLEEGRLPLFHRQPQDMGGADYNDQAPLLRRPVISRTRKFAQRAIIFLVALAVATSFITAAVNSTTAGGENRPSQPKESLAPKVPNLPKLPNPQVPDPSNPPNPMDPQPSADPEPIGAGKPYCPSATHILFTNSAAYDFKSGGRLTVSQSTHSKKHENGIHVHTAGEIHVRRLSENSPYKKGYITTDVRASDPKMEVERYTEKDTLMKIVSPQWAQGSSYAGDHPCVSIEITLWVPDSAILTFLQLEAETLSIRMFPDVTAHVDGDTYIKTISGSIHFPPSDSNEEIKSLGFGFPKVPKMPKMPKKSWWLPNIPSLRPKLPFFGEPSKESLEDAQPPVPFPSVPEASPEEHYGLFTSRKQYIETTSGSISGTFTLYDYLHITSVSGSLHVNILPQEEDADAPAPAELYLHSSSGSVEGYVLRTRMPIRDYITNVDGNSASLRGRFLLGNHATFQSNSGSIRLELLDGYTKASTKNSAKNRYLSTRTLSGSTRVELSEYALSQSQDAVGTSIEGSKLKDPMRNLSSSHHGTSGSMHLVYPSIWEGQIDATSISGSLRVEGEGIVIDHENHKWNKEIKAHKGKDVGNGKGSELLVSEISGSTEILIGGYGRK